MENVGYRFAWIERALQSRGVPHADAIPVDLGNDSQQAWLTISNRLHITIEALAQHIAAYYRLEYWGNKPSEVDPARRLPENFSRHYEVIAVAVRDGTMLVATSEPERADMLEQLRFIVGMPIKLVIATPQHIRRTSRRLVSAASERQYVGIIARKSVRHANSMRTTMNNTRNGICHRLHRGFTLIELMMVVAIVAILSAVGIALYTDDIIRAELAQTLTDYGVIRNVVGVETYAENRTSLEVGSVAGEVPPALLSTLNTRLVKQQFNEKGGMTLQLVRAPAGTFASYPVDDQYALIAKVSTTNGRYRLRLLRKLLPQGEGDKLWLSENELYFPLDVGTGEAPLGLTPEVPTTPPDNTPSSSSNSDTSSNTPPPATNPSNTPQTSWSNPQASANGNTWTASAHICVAGTDQQPLSGINAQVQFQVTQQVKTWDGQTMTRSWTTQVPLNDGCADFSQPDQTIPVSGQEGETALQFQVLDVIYYWPVDPPIKWDGVKPTVTIKAPQS